MEYQFGDPDEYGEFPPLYLNSNTDEEKFNAVLLERLPDEYPMQIVCPVEERVLADLSTLGIDAHLEAMTLTKPDRVENRMVGDKVIQRHHALDFTKHGMLCLIRRLAEYDPTQFDHSDCNFGHTDYDWDDRYTDSNVLDIKKQPYDFWVAASQLRSAILSTLDIDDSAC